MLSIQVWGTKVFVTDFYTKYLILVIFLNIYHYFGSTSHVFHNFHCVQFISDHETAQLTCMYTSSHPRVHQKMCDQQIFYPA